MKTKTVAGLAAAAIYVASVVLANYLTTRYGFVPVGFGQAATAGTLVIGGALVVRDVVQDGLGKLGVLALIAIAGLLSYLVADPFIASASAAAFLTSEILDMAVYTPLRKRAERFGDARWARAVAIAAVVGAVVDTVVFLWVAFGRSAILPAMPGQLVGKLEVAAALIILGSLVALLRQSDRGPRARCNEAG